VNAVEISNFKWKVLVLLLIGVLAFASIYVVFRTNTGFAVLTAPPPGILGPHYVTAEAKIYGPVVDLAAIKSEMNGTYSSDYTYVQWGTNPFHRVYADNTLQEIYYGQMVDVLDFLSWNFSLEKYLSKACDKLKNTGALDPTSILGQKQYFGNMPGVIVAYFVHLGPHWRGSHSDTFITDTTALYVAEAHFAYSGSPNIIGKMHLYLNDSICLYFVGPTWGYDAKAINSSGYSEATFNWTVKLTATVKGSRRGDFDSGVSIYLKDLLYLEAPANAETYTVVDSPGTGFVYKQASPSSPVAGSTINMTVKLDPPSAKNMNITDLYPNSFTWASVDVLLEKFKAGSGLVESAYVNVVPVSDGSNMKFTIYYNQAPNVLESLERDEYVYLTYSLRVPEVVGEYTLPQAAMSFMIPTP